MKKPLLLLLLLFLIGCGPERIEPPAPTVPPATKLILEPFAGGVGSESVVGIASAGDERMFVATQPGWIRVIHPHEVPFKGKIDNDVPFLDLRGQVAFSFEEGLLGFVFHPNFAENRQFYVSYTEIGTGDIVVVGYLVSAENPNIADTSTRSELIRIPKPRMPEAEHGYSNVHNAGDMQFAPDGTLYIAFGDGGPDPFSLEQVPGDPHNNGQRTDTLMGKIVRIDVDGDDGRDPDCGGSGYTIPKDNPYDDGIGGQCDEIWSLGWRNPWRISFDSLNGDLYATDVGEWEAEEINIELFGSDGGSNYGWHCWEGHTDFTGVAHVQGDCSAETTYIPPTYAYDHARGECSIIGGYVYRGEAQPALQGQYIFADYCTRELFGLRSWQSHIVPQRFEFFINAPWGANHPQWSAFGVDANGEIYIGAYLHDSLYRLVVDDS